MIKIFIDFYSIYRISALRCSRLCPFGACVLRLLAIFRLFASLLFVPTGITAPNKLIIAKWDIRLFFGALAFCSTRFLSNRLPSFIRKRTNQSVPLLRSIWFSLGRWKSLIRLTKRRPGRCGGGGGGGRVFFISSSSAGSLTVTVCGPPCSMKKEIAKDGGTVNGNAARRTPFLLLSVVSFASVLFR